MGTPIFREDDRLIMLVSSSSRQHAFRPANRTRKAGGIPGIETKKAEGLSLGFRR
jgi:hypothetical protein